MSRNSMLLPIHLGVDVETGLPVNVETNALSRHFHIVGATGTGKTVALHALLRPIMKQPNTRHRRGACLFVIDALGGLSRDLLMYVASPRCPSHVRRRLLYIEAANNDVVIPFNPLQFAVGDDLYFHVARTVDLIMRAWKSQDMSLQARLMQWAYAAMTALAKLGYPISLSEYLLHPGTDEHKGILRQLPEKLQHRWHAILHAKGGESTRILESTRNRFDPIYSAPQTCRMFGVSEGRFDVERLIDERRIVIINVAKLGKVPHLLGNTIGALMLNEILETAFRMATVRGRDSVDPTTIVLDEFQRFAASPDIEDALPTVRQAGLQLFLAHQSYSQLEQGDIDLRHMIFQAQNRLMFANHSEDADIIANELAVLTFDPYAVKKEIYQRKQLVKEHRRVWLESEGFSDTSADSVVNQRSFGYARKTGTSRHSEADGFGSSDQNGTTQGNTEGTTRAVSHSTSRSRSEGHLPVYEDLTELSSVQYFSFDEHRRKWERVVRQLKTGHCFGKFVDDDRLYRILVEYAPVRETQRAEQRLQELLQRNFEQDFFISKEEADRLREQARLRLLESPRIELSAGQSMIEMSGEAHSETIVDEHSSPPSPDPFRKSADNE